jgi:WD40 repeat protein
VTVVTTGLTGIGNAAEGAESAAVTDRDKGADDCNPGQSPPYPHATDGEAVLSVAGVRVSDTDTTPNLVHPQVASEASFLPHSYGHDEFLPALSAHQLHQAAVQLSAVNHWVSSKSNNVHLLDSRTILTAVGNTVVFFDTGSGTVSFIQGLDGGGIGATALHPDRSFFLVAEKSKVRQPNVYVYCRLATGTIELHRVLRNGTERAYSAASFNQDGSMIATVGSAPDYMITLWDWRKEHIILRSKAFSQEVYNIAFSPHFKEQLTTSGTGHIRFWKIASTFTGLKLVGNIGKFGKVELSDVCAFVELPDGKVLSGSESGQLLLWDGALIKVVLKRQGHPTCHDGNIEVLHHARDRNLILSAGQDGFIRMWDATKASSSPFRMLSPATEALHPKCRLNLSI